MILHQLILKLLKLVLLCVFQSFKAEDAQYADTKKDLRVQIRDMRRTVRDLL